MRSPKPLRSGAPFGIALLACLGGCSTTAGNPLIEVDRFVLDAGPGLVRRTQADTTPVGPARVTSADVRYGESDPNSATQPIMQSVVVSLQDLLKLIAAGAIVADAPEGSLMAQLNSGQLLTMANAGTLLSALASGWQTSFSFEGITRRRTLQGTISVDSLAGSVSGRQSQGSTQGSQQTGSTVSTGATGEVIGGEYRPHLDIRVDYRHHIPLLGESEYRVVLTNKTGLQAHSKIQLTLQLPNYIEVVSARSRESDSDQLARHGGTKVKVSRDEKAAGRWLLQCRDDYELDPGTSLHVWIQVRPRVDMKEGR